MMRGSSSLSACPGANFFVLGISGFELASDRISLPGVLALAIAIRLTFVSYDWTFIPLSNAGYLTMSLAFSLAVVAVAIAGRPSGYRNGSFRTFSVRPVSMQQARGIGLEAAGLLSRLLSNRFVLFFGEISYALYLIHQTVGFILIQRAERIGLSGTAAVVLTSAALVCVAAAITYRVERPAQRLLRAWSRPRQVRDGVLG